MKPDQAAIALRNGQRLDVDLDIAEHAIALTIPYLFRIIDPTQTIGSSGHSKFRQLCDNAGLPGNHPSNAAWMVLRALRIVPGDALMIETGCPISQGLASALGTVHTAQDAYIIRADRTNPDPISITDDQTIPGEPGATPTPPRKTPLP